MQISVSNSNVLAYALIVAPLWAFHLVTYETNTTLIFLLVAASVVVLTKRSYWGKVVLGCIWLSPAAYALIGG